MIAELVGLLERINKLPLTPDERAELMRAAINDARRDGGTIQRRPGPKADGKPSVASQVCEALREMGDWVRPRDIGTKLGMKSAPVSTALKDLVTRGDVERKEGASDERLANGRIIVW